MALTLIVEDSFTDTAFLDLASHTIAPTNIGGFLWTGAIGSGTMRIAGSGAGVGTAGGSRYYMTGTLAADHACEIQLAVTAADVDHGIWLRYLAAGGFGTPSGYRISLTPTAMELRRYDTGTPSGALESVSLTPSISDILYAQIIGTTIIAKLAGSTIFTHDVSADPPVYATGQVALEYGHTFDGWGDNWKVYHDAGTPVVVLPHRTTSIGRRTYR